MVLTGGGKFGGNCRVTGRLFERLPREIRSLDIVSNMNRQPLIQDIRLNFYGPGVLLSLITIEVPAPFRNPQSLPSGSLGSP